MAAELTIGEFSRISRLSVKTLRHYHAAHLERMEQQLARTQEAVASLRGLLEGHRDTPRVEYLDIPSQPALAITATIDRDGLEDRWRATFAQLRAENATVTGPPSGFYAHELFEEEAGEATVYLPVDALPEHPGAMILPPRRLATLRHDGPHTDIDLAYGALGTHVAERGLGAPGPVHERYLVSVLDDAAPADWRTEIGWPIATEAGA